MLNMQLKPWCSRPRSLRASGLDLSMQRKLWLYGLSSKLEKASIDTVSDTTPFLSLWTRER